MKITDKDFEKLYKEVAPLRSNAFKRYSFIDRDELESIVNNAVWEAVRGYEEGSSASIHAVIKARIDWDVADFLCKDAHNISITRDDYKVRKSIQRVLDEHPDYTYDDVAEELGVRKGTVLVHTQAIDGGSLDSPIPGGDGCTLGDFIPEEREEGLGCLRHKEKLLDVMSRVLSAKERDILCCLYGIGGTKMSCVELGQRYGVSHTAILKTKNASLQRLKESLSDEALCFSNTGMSLEKSRLLFFLLTIMSESDINIHVMSKCDINWREYDKNSNGFSIRYFKGIC